MGLVAVRVSGASSMVGAWIRRTLEPGGVAGGGDMAAGEAVDHQPHREALRACLVLDGAAMHSDLSCGAILFRNDAQAAIAAITKGSFHSPEMQRCTIRVHRRLFGQGTVGRRSNGRPMDASGTCQV